MITFDQLKSALERQPFVPLTLSITRGRTLTVSDPRQVLLTRTVLVVGTDIGADGIPENYALCAIAQLASIDPA